MQQIDGRQFDFLIVWADKLEPIAILNLDQNTESESGPKEGVVFLGKLLESVGIKEFKVNKEELNNPVLLVEKIDGFRKNNS